MPVLVGMQATQQKHRHNHPEGCCDDAESNCYFGNLRFYFSIMLFLCLSLFHENLKLFLIYLLYSIPLYLYW